MHRGRNRRFQEVGKIGFIKELFSQPWLTITRTTTYTETDDEDEQPVVPRIINKRSVKCIEADYKLLK